MNDVCAWVCVHIFGCSCVKQRVKTSAAERREEDATRKKMNGAGGGDKRDCQSQTNSEGSMHRLRQAYPRERQTKSSWSLQFKVVTRPLEFLILIASTGYSYSTGRERPERNLGHCSEKERENEQDCMYCTDCTVYCPSFLFLSFNSSIKSLHADHFQMTPKKSSIPWKCYLRGTDTSSA